MTTLKEQMEMLLSGYQPQVTPQWIMAFANHKLVQRLVPTKFIYEGFCEYPLNKEYPFISMGNEKLQKRKEFNDYIDRCAFPIGWGANMAFGHAGPGEFNKKVIENHPDYIVLEYETGAKKKIRYKPHNQHTFYLPVKTIEDMNRLQLPDPEAPERFDGFAEDVAWAKTRNLWTIGWVNGFFSGIHYFFKDYQQFLIDLLLNPELIKTAAKKIGEWNLKAAEMMCQAGVNCIGFCDDLGSNDSMLMSPDTYRLFFKNWHAKLCDLAHSYGAAVHMHSHGAIIPVLKDLAEIGIDILNPVDPDDNMPIEAVREIVGNKMILCGGIDKHFFDWPCKKQEEYFREIIRIGKINGPYIVMDSGGIPDNVNRSWFEWFLQMSKEIRTSI